MPDNINALVAVDGAIVTVRNGRTYRALCTQCPRPATALVPCGFSDCDGHARCADHSQAG